MHNKMLQKTVNLVGLSLIISSTPDLSFMILGCFDRSMSVVFTCVSLNFSMIIFPVLGAFLLLSGSVINRMIGQANCSKGVINEKGCSVSLLIIRKIVTLLLIVDALQRLLRYLLYLLPISEGLPFWIEAQALIPSISQLIMASLLLRQMKNFSLTEFLNQPGLYKGLESDLRYVIYCLQIYGLLIVAKLAVSILPELMRPSIPPQRTWFLHILFFLVEASVALGYWRHVKNTIKSGVGKSHVSNAHPIFVFSGFALALSGWHLLAIVFLRVMSRGLANFRFPLDQMTIEFRLEVLLTVLLGMSTIYCFYAAKKSFSRSKNNSARQAD